jgi:hypothetical protein
MEVTGKLHAPAALPPGKEPLVHIGSEARWAPEPVWTRWSREEFPAPAGTRTLITQPLAQLCTAELSRLCTNIVAVRIDNFHVVGICNVGSYRKTNQ